MLPATTTVSVERRTAIVTATPGAPSAVRTTPLMMPLPALGLWAPSGPAIRRGRRIEAEVGNLDICCSLRDGLDAA